MPSPGSRRLLRRGLVAGAVLLLLAAGAGAFLLLHKPGNVSHPGLSFTRPNNTPAPKKPPPDTFEWPRYGFDAARTRLFRSRTLGPPFRQGWAFDDRALVEFPPVLYQSSLYLVDDNGWAKAIDKRSGRLLWQNKIGTLAAASPALGIHEGLVLMPILSVDPNAGQNPGNGRVVALSMRTGKIVWSHPVPPGTESSPLVYGSSVYFGDQNGNVSALRARDGHVSWTYHASAAVKGGPSFDRGVIFFGDYAGRAYALNARTGKEVWTTSTNGAHFGFGSGEFYSTAAVAFGRVYMGNTDGRVYSFAERTGQLAWATGTGAYVYASPAVADIPGLGPTVYAGSYDGNFYAFDARSGSVRWTHNAGGKISGSATIVGDVVYFSVLGSRTTQGLDVRSGRQVFFFGDGAFNPVICDPSTVYLVGYTTIHQMIPRRAQLGNSLGAQISDARPPAAPTAIKTPQNPRK